MGIRRTILPVLACLLSAATLPAQPVISAVVNGASYSGTLSPGCWAAMFGSKLASGLSLAPGIPLPAKLNNVSVTVAGIAAPLLFVSPAQVNFLVPYEAAIPANGIVPVVITTAEGASAAFSLRLVRNSPAIFTIGGNGIGKAIAFNAGFQLIDAFAPDTPMLFYAAGLGPTNPAAVSASGGNSSEPFNRIVDNLEVFVGDVKADVLFAGLAPGFPGIYQVNVMPKGAASDRLYLRMGPIQSNIPEVAAPAAANVANVTGSIEGLYPSTGGASGVPAPGAIMQSVMFFGGAYTAAFDILPDAKPFTVIATGEGGSATFNFDPPKGTYGATIAVPSMAARSGDFSASEFPAVLDFANCPGGVCGSFPGSRIPASRLDPAFLAAINLISLPNAPPASPSATFRLLYGGSAPAGSRFVINNESPYVSKFGGFTQISQAGAKTRTTSFKLYVDGKLIASKDATYSVTQ